MTRSFGLVDYKIQEAEYFLLELMRLGKQINFAAAQFCASAFVSAARNITFAMQASLKGHPEFHYRTVFLSPYETIISEVVSSYILC